MSRKCRCGIDRKSKNGVWFCPNCDDCQPQERGKNPQPRKRTPHDVKYDVYWTKQMRSYPPVPETWAEDVPSN